MGKDAPTSPISATCMSRPTTAQTAAAEDEDSLCLTIPTLAYTKYPC